MSVLDNGDKDCDDFNYEVDKDKNNDNQGNKSNLQKSPLLLVCVDTPFWS